MIKDFKSFPRLQYVSWNEDIEKLNYGYREEEDDNQELQLVHHPESAFVRFQINPKEVPWKISFVKKNTSLRSKARTSYYSEEREKANSRGC